MGLWFLTALFVSFFTTAAFMYASDRINPYEDPITVGGQLLERCQLAAYAEAYENLLTGASSTVTFGCDSFPSPTNVIAQTLNLDAGTVSIGPGSTIGVTGRVIVTYLEEGETLKGMSFNRIREQLAKVTMNNTSVGIVTTGSPYKSITPLIATEDGSSVPVTIPDDALALVTTVNP